MSSKDAILSLRDALKLSNSTDANEKLEGLQKLRQILSQDESKLVDYGYDKVLLKELLKFVKFEEGTCLRATLDIIEQYYINKKEQQDNIMESLLHRYALSTHNEVSLMCLDTISSLIDSMDDNVAKHSKQLLDMTEITLPDSLSEKLEQILRKLKFKLPKRRSE